MNLKPLNSDNIKAEALRLGFFACGIAEAQAVDTGTAQLMRRWIAEGDHGDMEYLAHNTDKRLDPRLLMPGLKSIVCVALNYAPAETLPPDEYQLAAYALGQDYHTVVKDKLRQLASTFGLVEMAWNQQEPINDGRVHFRAFCDSAPILERYWAVKAGLGWTGRNRQLIIPRAGSMFFLGELFLDTPLQYDNPQPNRCGTCHQCIDACPTQAITLHEAFDAKRCLSYQTIEHHGDLSPQVADKMGQVIYGCDRCQQACPWNRYARPNHTPELQPKPELLSMTREKWQHLSEDDYRKLFKGSAVKRAKYGGLMRNIKAVDNNAHKLQHKTDNTNKTK